MAFQRGNKLGKKFEAGAKQAQISKIGAEKSKKVRAEQKSINQLVSSVINAQCPKEIEDNLKRYFPEGVMNVYDALLKKCVLKALDGKAKLKDLISCILILAKLSGQKLENDTQEGDNGNGILEKLLKANLDIQAKKGKK